MIRRPALFLICLLSCTFAPPARADSLLNYLFPSLFGRPYLGPDPVKTGIAPFAQTGKEVRALSADDRAALTSPENIVPITQAHRAEPYVAAWAAEHIAQVLTFDPGKMNELNTAIGAHFTPTGATEFNTWLATTSLATPGPLRVQAFTPAPATLLNAGEFGGAYRWLFDVPVTLAQIPTSMTSYAGATRPQVSSQNLTLRIQIVRTASGFKDGMAIERFTALPAL